MSETTSDIPHVTLKKQVEAAVFRAVSDGKTITKAGIVNQFLGHGAVRSTLHRWIDAAIADCAAHRLSAEMTTQAVPVSSAVGTLVETAGPLVTPPPESEAIDVMTRLAGCLQIFDAMIRISRNETGELKNMRLAGWAAGEIRKTIQTVINAQEVLQDFARQKKFIDAVLEEIEQIDPAVRDAIVARLRVVTLREGETE
jgi:hypothetical protein